MPSDDRPKPQYGELAPEGWEWKPPAPPEGSDVPVPDQAARPVPGYGGDAPGSGAGRDGRGEAPYPGAPGGNGALGRPSAPHRGDIIATSLLLFLSILFSASMVPALFDFTTVLRQAAAMQGYEGFSASPSTQTAGFVAGVATIILNLASIVISVRRVQRQKLAFFVPIVFGVVTFAVWIGVISFAFFNDPGFLQSVTSTPRP
ncbi:hypothetical protein C5B96_08630 [Subtercola sp. Z020]|uniref:DUF6264 family protein n=1 Tax=Subtercola sp. Z020 TaxID=2080582 RepID=UPI000CE8832A|nr:DUF6264 family protein [Subtercola sp. Z020]PPF82992.1 hypothetical protein C5B96_08630 [Subtercola sp. Z020]